MINNIVDAFRRQAKEHKTIKAFYYNRSYELGSGKEKYPLFWLEDPIVGRNQDNVFTNTTNFSVLLLPDKEKSMVEMQSLAFSAGLNILERMKQDKTSAISIRPDWSYITLQDYYDDNACGCRFTVNMTHVNMQNLCLIDEQFDPEKEFESVNSLHGLPDSWSGGIDLFADKLPQFDLKQRR